MQVTEKIINIDSTWFSPEREVKRSKGLHLSRVIDYIEYCEGKRDGFGTPISNQGQAYAVGGFAWERVLHRLLENDPEDLFDWLFGRALNEPDNPKIIRPGEQCIDLGECTRCKGCGEIGLERRCKMCGGSGRFLIYMTPDGYHIDDMMLEEYKATSKSAKSPIDGQKFRRWTRFQIPAYLKALNLLICRLRVYFSRGDYTSGTPIWKEFILEYSEQEIEETWTMIANHAIEMYEKGLLFGAH